jgi:hypothetical protein
MPVVVWPPPLDHPIYIANLVEKRRDLLRFARSLPRGPRRNQLRQSAESLHGLFKNKKWLDANTPPVAQNTGTSTAVPSA